MANRRFNTQTTQPLKSGGRAKMMGGGMSTARKDMRSGYYPSDMGMAGGAMYKNCLLYTSPSPRDGLLSRMPSSA